MCPSQLSLDWIMEALNFTSQEQHLARSKFRTTSVRGINKRAIFQELLDVVFVTAAHGIVQLRPA